AGALGGRYLRTGRSPGGAGTGLGPGSRPARLPSSPHRAAGGQASDRSDESFDLGLGGGRGGRSASASAHDLDAGFLGDDRSAGIVVDPQSAFGIAVDLALGHHAQIHGGGPAAADVVVAV